MLDGFVVIFTATMNCGKGGIGYCADCKSAPLNAFHLPLAAGPLQNLLYNKELMNQPLLSYIPEVCKRGLRLRCCKTKRCRVPSTSPCLVWSCGKRGIRTPETLLGFTRFPGGPVQPLLHLSVAAANIKLFSE